MIRFNLIHPRATMDHLGLVPEFFWEADPRPAKEQINERYAHGGGWFPIEGFEHRGLGSIKYPGDPVMTPLASAQLHDETIYVYESGWTMILQPDGSYEVTRMD